MHSINPFITRMIAVVFLSTSAISQVSADAIELHFDLKTQKNRWGIGYADYPNGQEHFYELGWRKPPVKAPDRPGLRLTGNNHSDDLFMYAKTKISGLPADTAYAVNMTLIIESNAAKGCFGVGGAPGESVTLKAGATHAEPLAFEDASDGYLRMNIDKGNQSTGGSDALVLGHIATDQTDCYKPRYMHKMLSSDGQDFMIRTDDKGEFWLWVGTDSGFESTTTLYLKDLWVGLEPIEDGKK